MFRRTESDAERDISLIMENPGRAVKLMAIPVGFALLIAQINSFVDAAWCATLGLYFFFKIRRAHEAEAAAPASTGARYSRKYVFCDNGCSAPHDKLQVIAAAPPSEEAGSVCAPMAITDTACFTDAVALTDTAPVTETAVLRPPA